MNMVTTRPRALPSSTAGNLPVYAHLSKQAKLVARECSKHIAPDACKR